MKTFIVLGILVISFLTGAATQGKKHQARPYQTAVGKMEQNNGNSVVIDRNPCGDANFLNFEGNFRINPEKMQKQCPNGKTYEAVQVTQCGGDRDKTHPICKSPN